MFNRSDFDYFAVKAIQKIDNWSIKKAQKESD